MVNFDDLLDDINGFGIYQKIRLALVCIAGILPPLVIYSHSFSAANPKHRCTLPNIENDTYSLNTSYIEDKYNISLHQCFYMKNDNKYKCEDWVYDKTYYQSTLTEEWEMICDKTFWRSNLQTFLFCGILVGSIILGILADRFGRKKIMLLSFILISFASFGAAFGPQKMFGVKWSYSLYAICRFLLGLGTRGINTVGFVLALELVSSKKRTFAGIVFQYFFAIGQLVLMIPVYFIRDWRPLGFFSAFSSIPFLFYFFILPESPRWLLSKNHNEKAHKVLKQVAKSNKTVLDEDLWINFLAKHTDTENNNQESFFMLRKSKSLCVITVTLFVHWIANNLMFYGVGLKSNDLGVNPYLSFTISAFVELLGLIMSHAIVDCLGRKYPYGIFLTISGIACLSIVFTDNKYFIVCLAMIGKFFVSASYGILYIYSSEIFPTSIRSSCVGACSMMGRLGSMVAPQINGIGDKFWPQFPFLVFGISGALIGLSTLILPETLGRHLPKTIEEAERNKAFGCCSKKQTKR